MLSREFVFSLFINYVYIHIQVDARVLSRHLKETVFLGNRTETKIYNMQALKVYCGTGLIKELLLFSFVNSPILTTKKVKRIVNFLIEKL